jgi:hypothetical protein
MANGITMLPPYTAEQLQEPFAKDLAEVLGDLQALLLEKNRKYGDAALNPNQTFSTATPIELINVRMDDKLSRIRNRQNDEDEDVEVDLIGYLILKQIAKKRLTRKPK